jgi:transglutaminase-like putative cysteine protease
LNLKFEIQKSASLSRRLRGRVRFSFSGLRHLDDPIELAELPALKTQTENLGSPRLTVRIGCHLVYETPAPTPVLFLLQPRNDRRIKVVGESLSFGGLPSRAFLDNHGNTSHRSVLRPGRNEIRHDALVSVSSLPDKRDIIGQILSAEQLPSDILRYTLPSRYCDSDKLQDFAWNQFGHIPHGQPRVQAICDWVHENIEYRFGSGRSDLSASEVIARRHGVCRDFAHTTIALCRAFSLPARYVTGHLPDIGYNDPGTPMDFHAYCEVYLGKEWLTFDARFNVPRIGRIKIAHGNDAVDVAFSTTYGQSTLTGFEVWAYQVDPLEVSVGDPIDLSKRLDGTVLLRTR